MTQSSIATTAGEHFLAHSPSMIVTNPMVRVNRGDTISKIVPERLKRGTGKGISIDWARKDEDPRVL